MKAESSFGSNADELRDSYSLYNSTCIKPFQSTLLESLDQIFRLNGIDSLDIYFKTLKPADFLDLDVIDAIDEQTEGIDIKEVTEDVDMDDQTIEKMEQIIAKHKKKKFSDINVKDDNVDISFFDDIGLTLDKDEWFEAHVDSIDEDKIDKRYHEFAYAPAGTPNVADSSSDIGMFRVLYRYSQTLSVDKRTGQISSREFCQKMVAKSVAGTLYRMEDLELASTRAVNKGFGAGGSNTYNIALWKGGANCKHRWERVFYFRRIVPKGMTFVDVDGKEYTEGEYLPNGTLNNFKEVSQAFANGKMPMPEDAEMRKTTWRMKNHGFLKPRKEKERSYKTNVG